jgi:hypothetical protein
MRLEILREGAHLGTRVLTDFEIVAASGGIQQFTEAANSTGQRAHKRY